ncbi:hypothetical protein [Gordonia hankookensis]|uniref:Uncharacterized protein n=1 Tax=Gordonia hankookensis TaxID=589403 RepID=A0ABR7WH59_9ACTN|nr:hypothetical protein [Gordonia hankookensis]MBD1322100.1 hypothetical protein [Gordonia hankookensis]
MKPAWPHHLVTASAGAVATNVVPHLAHGLAGRPFPTPFSDPPGVGDSSPAQNIVWASMNAGVAGAMVYTQRTRLRSAEFWGVFGVSATAAAFGLRSYFGRVRASV